MLTPDEWTEIPDELAEEIRPHINVEIEAAEAPSAPEPERPKKPTRKAAEAEEREE